MQRPSETGFDAQCSFPRCARAFALADIVNVAATKLMEGTTMGDVLARDRGDGIDNDHQFVEGDSRCWMFQ